MAFRITDRTYTADGHRKHEVFGIVEGYTSNTVGETFLRMNIKCEMDEEMLVWYQRCYGTIPFDVLDVDHETGRCYMRERRVGDVVGEGIRLDRKQVVRLVWELIKWLVRGY